MNSQEHIDYLAVGHICHDLTQNGPVIGGAAAYGAGVAQVMGCRTAVVTSSAPEDDWLADLPGITIHRIPSPQTTLFENVYTPAGRVQTIHAIAGRLTAPSIPGAWQRASIVHLAPIANEVDPDILHLFSNSLVGLAPQGWMRRWDDDGKVSAGPWAAAEEFLRLAAAVFISEEDLLDGEMLEKYRDWSRLLVMTQGQDGCTIFLADEARHFPAVPGSVVDTTGAGDIFAAAFLVRLFQTGGNPSEAAKFANKVASLSITTRGLRAKMAAISTQQAAG
jgi:sugar/nucleoside kinase (ribokinase family)